MADAGRGVPEPAKTHGTVAPPPPVSVLAGAVVVGVLVAVAGIDLQHSDLAVQTTLAAVRAQPDAFAHDLVADHAALHPGLWLDLVGLVPELAGVFGGALLCVATALGGAVLGWQRGSSRLAAWLTAAAVLLPRAIPGGLETLPWAPVSRLAVVPLVLSAWACAPRRPGGAGVLGGLAVAVHPTIGGAALLLMGLRLAGRPWPIALGAVVAAPVLLPAMLLAVEVWPGEAWWPVVSVRWGQHLALSTQASLWAVLGLAGWALWADRVALPVGLAVGSGLVALGLSLGGAPVWLARLHPLHVWAAVGLWVLIDSVPRAVGQRRWWVVVMIMCWTVSWKTGARGVQAVPELSSAWGPVLADPRRAPFGRASGLGWVVSVKDGAEGIADPRLAQRWATRLRAVCGEDVLVKASSGEGPGWARVRDGCAPPTTADGWWALARQVGAGVVVVPRSAGALPLTEVWSDERDRWYLVVEAGP